MLFYSCTIVFFVVAFLCFCLSSIEHVISKICIALLTIYLSLFSDFLSLTLQMGSYTGSVSGIRTVEPAFLVACFPRWASSITNAATMTCVMVLLWAQPGHQWLPWFFLWLCSGGASFNWKYSDTACWCCG